MITIIYLIGSIYNFTVYLLLIGFVNFQIKLYFYYDTFTYVCGKQGRIYFIIINYNTVNQKLKWIIYKQLFIANMQ